MSLLSLSNVRYMNSAVDAQTIMTQIILQIEVTSENIFFMVLICSLQTQPQTVFFKIWCFHELCSLFLLHSTRRYKNSYLLVCAQLKLIN